MLSHVKLASQFGPTQLNTMPRNYDRTSESARLTYTVYPRPFSRHDLNLVDESNAKRDSLVAESLQKSGKPGLSNQQKRPSRRNFGWSQFVKEIAQKQGQELQRSIMIDGHSKNTKVHYVELSSSNLQQKTNGISSRSTDATKSLPSGLAVVECPLGHKRLIGGGFRSSQQLLRCRHCEYLATIKKGANADDETPDNSGDINNNSNSNNSSSANSNGDDQKAFNQLSDAHTLSPSSLGKARNNILELVLPVLSSKSMRTPVQSQRSRSILQRIVLRPPAKSADGDETARREQSDRNATVEAPSSAKQAQPNQPSESATIECAKRLLSASAKTPRDRESTARKTAPTSARSPQDVRSAVKSALVHWDPTASTVPVSVPSEIDSGLSGPRYTSRSSLGRGDDVLSARNRGTSDGYGTEAGDVNQPISKRCVPLLLPRDETREREKDRDNATAGEDVQEEVSPSVNATSSNATVSINNVNSSNNICCPNEHILRCTTSDNLTLEEELRRAKQDASKVYKNPFVEMPLRMFIRLQDIRKLEVETIKLEEQNLWTMRQILKKKKKRK